MKTNRTSNKSKTTSKSVPKRATKASPATSANKKSVTATKARTISVTKSTPKRSGNCSSKPANSVRKAVSTSITKTIKTTVAKATAKKVGSASTTSQNPKNTKKNNAQPVVSNTAKKASPTTVAGKRAVTIQPAAQSATKNAGNGSSTPANAVVKVVSDNQMMQANEVSADNADNNLVTVEIRIHNDANGGHPHIMVDAVDNKFVSVGMTHDQFKGKNHPNIALEHDPLGDSNQTYMHRQGTVDNRKNYSATSKTGEMTALDNKKAQEIGEKAKQKYLSQQKSKKV